MLDNEQLYIMACLRSSMMKEAVPDASIIEDGHGVIDIIFRNGILLTVYKSLSVDLQEQLKNQYYAAIKQSVTQGFEGHRVLNALSGAGLSCIALKGWELRNLYPDPTMRQMADLDVLVKPYDFERIKTVMEKLGFSGGSESSWKHDSFKKKEVHVEMHKRLTDDSDAIQAWEKGIWDRAQIVNGTIYRMSCEDFAIFHFVHLHKDFMNGSLGLRRIIDTWLLLKQPADWENVKETLTSFGMGTFYDRMTRLCRAALGEEPMDKDSEIMLKHSFTFGIYGTGKSYKAGRIASMSSRSRTAGKINSFLSAIFLPYSRMKAQFPTLRRYPILLPYFWIKRIFRFLKGNMKKSREMLDYSSISEEDYCEMKHFFRAGGIYK